MGLISEIKILLMLRSLREKWIKTDGIHFIWIIHAKKINKNPFNSSQRNISY